MAESLRLERRTLHKQGCAMTEQKTSLLLVCCTVVLGAGIFILDLWLPRGVAEGVLYTTLVLLSLWSPRGQFTLMVATGATVLTILGFVFSPPGSVLWLAVLNRLLALFTIWVVAILLLLRKREEEKRESLVLELQEALAQIKTLRGLLPICASCNKIRNEQGSWAALEGYIEGHSEAHFTHSICPECSTKLYPELGCAG